VGFRGLGFEAVLVAMLVAVVLPSYLSRFAIHLEASPWLHRAHGAGTSEVAVEIEVAAT
jgi:hypothetical protein